MRRQRKNKKQVRLVLSLSVCLLLVMTIGYAAFSTNLTITGKGNIVEKLKNIKSWSNTSNEDFHTEFYRKNIININFINNVSIPSDFVENWDISADGRKGVIAYVKFNKDNPEKYDLYIGAKGGVVANQNSGYMFYNFTEVTSINFNNNFDTSNVTNMISMFQFCTNLETIDISTFDTANVTNMQNMFGMFNNTTGTVEENKLTEIIFGEKWSTKNVTQMAQMFAGCKKITTIDVSNWDTSNVINMGSVFAHCYNLKSVDVSKWNTGNVNDMSWLFMACSNLTSLDLDNWNTSKVTAMRDMFLGCTKLKSLNLCSFDTRKVSNMYQMFRNTTAITQIKIGPNFTTAGADTTNMFFGSGVEAVTTGQC
ncbi:MAG: BspA family leucine-rich repeat surface protein [Bacilli bacterium]